MRGHVALLQKSSRLLYSCQRPLTHVSVTSTISSPSNHLSTTSSAAQPPKATFSLVAPEIKSKRKSTFTHHQKWQNGRQKPQGQQTEGNAGPPAELPIEIIQLASRGVHFVDKPHHLVRCLRDLNQYTNLMIDMEGVNLSKNGTLSLLQISGEGSDTIWVIDVKMLGKAAFENPTGNLYSPTNSEEMKSLGKLFEDNTIEKNIYACRNDVNALYHLYSISPQNVLDLQVLEVATRQIILPQLSHQWMHSLFASVFRYLQTTYKRDHDLFMLIKNSSDTIFDPTKGGSVDAFDQRPLNDLLLVYASQDVKILSLLKKELKSISKKTDEALYEFSIPLVRRESMRRVEEAMSDEWIPNGADSKSAPLLLRGIDVAENWKKRRLELGLPIETPKLRTSATFTLPPTIAISQKPNSGGKDV